MAQGRAIPAAASPPGPPRSYAEFWPFYVREHDDPATRSLHFIGTSLGLACLVLAVALRQWWLVLVRGRIGREVDRLGLAD